MKWSLKGFNAISKGTFGNAGQNLYVSKKGVLQRIWQFDVNGDGYVDILVANSHGFNEHPNTHIITDPTGEEKLQEVLTQDGQAGFVTDLNGNGYDDLIIATANDGHHMDLSSYVYFGGKDGITENRKIDLAAKGCTCVAVGDVNGDGKREICYLVEDPKFYFEATRGRHIRIYNQSDIGFMMGDFKDAPATWTNGDQTEQLIWFVADDIDGDGYDDLYCRTSLGRWLILWGSADGVSIDNSTEVLSATDDQQRFDVLEFGGGNVGFAEFARPSIVNFDNTKYLFYSDKDTVKLVHFEGRALDKVREFRVPGVQSIAVGHIMSAESDDLVMLQVNSLADQHALVFYGKQGYDTPAFTYPIKTPRKALLCDFSGNGHDDLVIAMGRDEQAFTSRSLLFKADENGLSPEPKKFTTHNCTEAYAADFTKSGKKSLVFINQQESYSYGHVPVYVYLGSKDGYSPENRLEFPGHSAGTMMPIDFTDNGYTDILVLHNAEDQPQKMPPADLYFGGPDGFSLENKVQIPAPRSWGGTCADINKDGYLDFITTGAGIIRIFYGSEKGFAEENIQVINPANKIDPPPGILWPTLADLNGDGWLDLITPMSLRDYSCIFWGGPDGFSLDRCQKLPIEGALSVRIADLNKDGYPDIVFGSRVSKHKTKDHEGTVTIFWGGPDGYSGYNCCVLPSYQTNNITIADFTGDGWLDVFASSYFNGKERDINSYIYWNDKGNFSLTNRKRMFAHSSSAAWACDFNEDGYNDIFLSHHRAYGNHNTESAIWWNGPEGFKEENRSWLPTVGPHDLVPNDCGDVMNRSPEETYITPIAVVENLSRVGWTADMAIKTWVNCQIRTASTEAELESAEFIGPDGTENTRFECFADIPCKLVRGKYLQIKLFIGAVNSGNTPRITEIFAD